MRRLLTGTAWTLLATDLWLLLVMAVATAACYTHVRLYMAMLIGSALSAVLTGALVYMATGYRRVVPAALGPFLGELLELQAVLREHPGWWRWQGALTVTLALAVAPAALGLAGAVAVGWLRRGLAARAGSSRRSQDGTE